MQVAELRAEQQMESGMKEVVRLQEEELRDMVLPMVVLGKWAVSFERGTPVLPTTPEPRERILYWQPTGPNPLNLRMILVDRSCAMRV